MSDAAINGLRLYYETHGEGDSLLLIAGLGCDIHVWQPVIGGLSQRLRVIAFDNRGAGRSDVPEEPYGIRDMADDAVKLLDHLNIRSAHVVGYSMGGYVAQEIAINYPGRVDRLILESTAAVSSARNNILFRRMLELLRGSEEPESVVRDWSFWLFAPARFEDGEYIDAYVRDTLANPYAQSVEGYRGQIRAISTFDARDRVGKIGAETLVIEGEEDILITPREAEALVRGIPGSSLLLVEGAAHRLHTERPEKFVKIVSGFLGRG